MHEVKIEIVNVLKLGFYVHLWGHVMKYFYDVANGEFELSEYFTFDNIAEVYLFCIQTLSVLLGYMGADDTGDVGGNMSPPD